MSSLLWLTAVFELKYYQYASAFRLLLYKPVLSNLETNVWEIS
jgi:hypothetical protein